MGIGWRVKEGRGKGGKRGAVGRRGGGTVVKRGFPSIGLPEQDLKLKIKT